MSRHSNCPHILTFGDITEDELHDKSQGYCHSCNARGPNLWACLHIGCGYVGCGESAEDHSTDHSKSSSHSLTMNLTTLRVWCYNCETEVFLKNNYPDLKSILELRRRNAHIRAPPEVNTQNFDDDSDSNDDNDSDVKPRGLTGLKNIGNTCYLNAALQALSNCPPLTQFFLECDGFLKTDAKPAVSKSYQKLTSEIWDRRRRSYVVPSTLVHGIKLVYPMFRGFVQQDTQEFLRCLMDRMHEELKEPLPTFDDDDDEEDEPKTVHTLGHRRERSRELVVLPDSETHSLSPGSADTLSVSGIRICDHCLKGTKCTVQECTKSSTSKKHKKRDKGRKNKNHPDTNKDKCEKCACEIKLGGGSGNDVQSRSTDVTDTVETKAQKEESQRSPRKGDLHGRKEFGKRKKKKSITYRSVISDIFDGKILSSVQCLTCNTLSSTKETFQDLSLPIPGKDDLVRIHASQNSTVKIGTCADAYNSQGWISWIYDWMRSWFMGPHVTLDDCLAAFFAADDLKGDNMYSCEKCKKLRNGVKMSQVMELPEILCIHLKRFRHEMMYSSKITNYVSFPLESLDMKPFLSQDSPSKCSIYDLVGVICHHGTAGGGHYTAYCQNWINGQWYEFDDMYVTEVHGVQVANSEAYVLFYRKNSPEALKERQKVVGMTNTHEPSLLQFFVSQQWLNKFNTFSEPGPITNYDFLCKHGGVPPSKANYVEDIVTSLPQPVWEYLYNRFGGGPAVNHLYTCPTCQIEMEKLDKRRKEELETFVKLNNEFQNEGEASVIYFISMSWFRDWESFVKGKLSEPPGAIDNSDIAVNKGGQWLRKNDSDCGQISEDMWNYLYSIYGGEPELARRQDLQEPARETQSAADDSPQEENGEEKGCIDQQEKE